MLRIRQLPLDYALRNLARSRTRLAATLLGASLVVLLILAASGFVRGMQLTLSNHESLHDNIIILGTGSEESVERSQIDAGVAGQAAASIPGLRTENGVIYAALPIHAEEGAAERQAVMRGVRPVALLVHSEVEITHGRPPRVGEDEIMLGALAGARLGLPAERLVVGQTLWFDNRPWTISGRFTAPNTVMDAEVWIPLTDLQIATKRENTLSCVILTPDTATFADADLFAKSRLDLEIAAIRESDYYASIGAFFRPIRIMILVTATLVATGGVLGGLNTMYASFASRVREVGMLQSLGYTRRAVVASLAEESLFVAACGALIACVIALLVLDGLAVRFSMGAFALTIDPPVLLVGLAAGLAVGVVGAIPPAIRCLRLPIAAALRSH
jgi:putative ABC transport system permease protein